MTLAVRSHLFPSRTQKLSSLAPTILDWRRSGKIGCCCIQKESIHQKMGAFLFGYNNHSHTDNRKAIVVWKRVESFKRCCQHLTLNLFLCFFGLQVIDMIAPQSQVVDKVLIRKSKAPTELVGVFCLFRWDF